MNRRAERAYEQWNAPVGTPVVVTFDDHATWETKTHDMPRKNNCGTPTIIVEGKPPYWPKGTRLGALLDKSGEMFTEVALARVEVKQKLRLTENQRRALRDLSAQPTIRPSNSTAHNSLVRKGLARKVVMGRSSEHDELGRRRTDWDVVYALFVPVVQGGAS